jgi:hypothetical protein
MWPPHFWSATYSLIKQSWNLIISSNCWIFGLWAAGLILRSAEPLDWNWKVTECCSFGLTSVGVDQRNARGRGAWATLPDSPKLTSNRCPRTSKLRQYFNL